MKDKLHDAIALKQGEYDKTPRINIDALKVFNAIRASLPGTWRVMKAGEPEAYDGGARRYIYIERESDGLRLDISSSTNYNREPAIRAALGYYTFPDGQSVDLRWSCRRAEISEKICARMDISKTTSEKLAKAITRRVIEPALKVLPTIKQQLAEAQARADKKAATAALLKSIEGVEVWSPSYRANEIMFDAGPVRGSIDSDGDLRIERANISAEFAEQFVRAMRQFKKAD